MKVQTVVAAAAIALTLSSFAEAWFDADVANIQSWPAQGWSNTENTTYDDGVISLSGVTNDLTYTALPAKTLGGSEVVTVSSEMKFSAYEEDDIPAVPADSKAALIVVEDGSTLSYMGLVKDGSTNTWAKLAGATPSEGTDVNVSISLKANKVQYNVDGGTLTLGGNSWLDIVAEGTVSQAVYNGTGEIAALSGATEAVTASFTLAWPAGYTAVSYQIGEGTPVSITGTTSPFSVPGVAANDVVTFVVQNADGALKTLTGTVGTDEGINAADATFTWADYLGDAVNGAYEIDNLAELKLFQKGIAIATNEVKFATAGETFKLTADIALDAPWPGIGVQNGKDIYSTDNFNAAAFCGTFDGQNHTISGFQMIGKGDKAEGLDYCGFFNSTYSATIQNLKIAYAGSLFAADTTAGTKESGATFVGVAKNSTLRNLTTVAGTVSCSKGFGGIVGYTTSGTTVDSCTNNLNMTSLANNKCGGIAMITQGGSAVTIRNCQNNGTQTTGSSNFEYGAIVGYVGLNTTIADCETTVGRFLKHQGSTVTLQGVNKGDARVASYHGAATPGLNFATVDGDVATFVADDALALNGSYKVMSAGATATFAFAEAGTIAFDTALFTPTFAITAANGLTLTDATDGTVTTYTAASSGYSGGAEGKIFTIDSAKQAELETLLGGKGKTLTDTASAASGLTYAQAYALGLLDEESGDLTKDIAPTIEVKDGKVVISIDADAKAAYRVMLTVYESTSLAPAVWTAKTPYELGSATEAAGFVPADDGAGFYKVGVTIEDAAE